MIITKKQLKNLIKEEIEKNRFSTFVVENGLYRVGSPPPDSAEGALNAFANVFKEKITEMTRDDKIREMGQSGLRQAKNTILGELNSFVNNLPNIRVIGNHVSAAHGSPPSLWQVLNWLQPDDVHQHHHIRRTSGWKGYLFLKAAVNRLEDEPGILDEQTVNNWQKLISIIESENEFPKHLRKKFLGLFEQRVAKIVQEEVRRQRRYRR